MARTLELRVDAHPGGPVLHRQFTRFISELTDLTDLWHVIARDLQASAERAFASEGASSGSAWAPLTAAYASWKGQNYPGKTILRRTDVLYKSLVHDGPGHVHSVSPRAMLWGTEVPWAGFLQGGTRRMKARPIIRLTGQDQSDMTKTVHHYLLAAAAGRHAGSRVP